MRKIFYIFVFLVCVSCSQSAKKSLDTAPSNEELKLEDDAAVESNGWRNDIKNKDIDFKSLETVLKNINLETEITEKLQANFEAQLLATKHPEFADAIKEQLADSNKFTASLADSIQNITIQDVQFVGKMSNQNDSISTQKITYTTLINSVYKQKDSALIVMKRALIDIDNTVKVNTSFLFERLED